MTMAAVFDSADAAWTRSHRTIAVAIAASLAIHVFALFELPRFQSRPQRVEPAPLVAHLVRTRPAPEPPSAAPLPPAPREKPDPPQEPVRSVTQPVRKPVVREARARAVPVRAVPAERPPALVTPVPEPTPAPIAEAPVPATLPSPAPAAPAVAPPAAAVRPQPAGSPTAEATEASEGSAFAKYRIAIILAARRYRSYPRVAIDNGWEGRVDVRLSIDANGAMSSIGIGRASEHAILDEAALDMIRRARPLAVIPAPLRGRAFSIDLPVLFNLKDELR